MTSKYAQQPERQDGTPHYLKIVATDAAGAPLVSGTPWGMKSLIRLDHARTLGPPRARAGLKIAPAPRPRGEADCAE